jgi:NAD(P)-dependent dehydrogenase (short-subunit alcohol dehydrogenase family)
MTVLAGSGASGILDYGTDWLYLLVPLAAGALIAIAAIRHGRSDADGPISRLLLRFADGMARRTGLPAYAAGGIAATSFSLLIAALGFYWDVAWHVDFGRDATLFTPGHTAILTGIGGIFCSGLFTVFVARHHGIKTWGGRALIALGLGATAGFPLDEFWHRAYGVDVTMWGPTHLLMIGGASFAPLAMLLLLHEGKSEAVEGTHLRRITAVICGAVLMGLSTFQLEYDLGISQWQQLYQPVLIAIAAGVGLVVARKVLGPGGALLATLHFTILRLLFAFIVGGPLHHVMPHWALYFGSAVAVELALAASAQRSALAQALSAGVAIATVGLASEWGWTHVFGRHGWGPGLFPGVLIASLGAVAAAVIGVAIASALRSGGGTARGPRTPWVALAGALAITALALPFPRHDAPASITVRSTPVSDGRVAVTVDVVPPSVIDNPDWFEVFAWQGGHLERTTLRRTGPQTWTAEDPIPVGGSWKTIVRLAQRDLVAGAPVWFPADPEIGAPEVPVVAERTVPFDRDSKLLMRESRSGKATTAVVAYIAIGLVALGWLTALTAGLVSRSRRRAGPLAGRRLLVTGALGGIGTATVAALRAHGAEVIGLDLVGGDDVVAADVRDLGSVSRAVDEAAARLGGIDAVVCLAGIGRAQDAGAAPGDDARAVLEINFFGTWNCISAALPHLLASPHRGHVVVTASGLAHLTVPWAAAYAASKRAVTAYADTLRLEYAGRLTVTTVDPGYLRTPIHESSTAAGASLEGLVPAERIEDSAAAFVTACTDRPRKLATSWQGGIAFAIADRAPGFVSALVMTRLGRSRRAQPSFVLDRDALAATAQRSSDQRESSAVRSG